jgi:hypothetical protein
MFDDREDATDGRAPAWAWLRGFAYFLLAWPLMSLLALDQFELDDWKSILLAVLGPAGIGLVLLGIERGLTLLFGGRAARAQAVPSTLRDVSNLGLAMAILLVIDVALVTIFDDEQIVSGGDPETATFAIVLLAICGGVMLLFRGLHRLVYGRERVTDLGEGWDVAPNTVRLFGYLTLIPTLLVCTVMIDYALHRRPEFGLTAWIILPALLWLGLRSAMARSPRWWARNPWEVWLRRNSLALPWWVIAAVFGLGLGVIFLLLPTGLIDGEDMTTTGRVVAGIVGIPLGLIVLFGVGVSTVNGLPKTVREWRTARLLARRPEALVGLALQPDSSVVLLRLADGREVAFDMDEDGYLPRSLTLTFLAKVRGQ